MALLRAQLKLKDLYLTVDHDVGYITQGGGSPNTYVVDFQTPTCSITARIRGFTEVFHFLDTPELSDVVPTIEAWLEEKINQLGSIHPASIAMLEALAEIDNNVNAAQSVLGVVQYSRILADTYAAEVTRLMEATDSSYVIDTAYVPADFTEGSGGTSPGDTFGSAVTGQAPVDFIYLLFDSGT